MPLSAFLLPLALVPSAQSAEAHSPTLDPEARIELEAFWEPCRSSLYGLFDETPALRAPRAAEPRRTWSAEAFRPFLPQGPVEVGEVWRVDSEAVLGFLRQLHPGAQGRGESFGGEVPGTFALLRAVGPEAFELLLRSHAVFQLEDGVIYKPAQFEGRLLLGREDGALLAFSLALPSRDTNVDVNVPLGQTGPNGRPAMSADIGWVPRLELTSAATAASDWTLALPEEEARLALRRAFYPFAALDWLPFEEAVIASRERGKPLHLVLLFGCLDDASC